MTSPSGASFEQDRAATSAPTGTLGVARGLVRAARPRQWVKNGFVFVPAAFGGALLTHLVPIATVTGVLLMVVGTGLAVLISWKTAAIVGTYVVCTLAYTFGLKRMVIVDVMLLAAGFVLRLWGGAAAADVQASTWLLLCMLFLALFLGFGKRRH